MSEEKKPEKWEKLNWFLYKYSEKYRYYSSKLKTMAFKYGKITINDNNFSIGDFTLSFNHIKKIEREQSLYIIIYCPDCSDVFELGDTREQSGYCPTCKR